MAEVTHSMQTAVRADAFRAENSGISAKPLGKRSFDAQFAEAFRGLEFEVMNLASAASVFEMVADKFLGKANSQEDDLSFEMTRCEWETLFYAMYQLTNQTRDLKTKYLAGFHIPTAGEA